MKESILVCVCVSVEEKERERERERETFDLCGPGGDEGLMLHV